jgi:uncharacterized coiled-coil protein SlyX
MSDAPSDTTTAKLEAAIRDLQVRFAFLDDSARQQDQVVFELSRTIDRLTIRVEQLEERLAALAFGEGEVGPANEPPPHY